MPELPEVETVANGVHARVAGSRITSVWTSGKPQTFKSSEKEIVATLSGARIERVRRVGKTIVMDLGRRGTQGQTQIPFGNDNKKGKSKGKGRYTDTNTDRDRDTDRDTDTDTDTGTDTAAGISTGKRKGTGRNETTHDTPAQFLVHLGMTGRLLVSQPEVPLPPHTHAVLTLGDGREVRFVDPRRFGRLSVYAVEAERDPVDGPQRAARAHGRHAGYTGPGAEPTTINAADFAKLFRKRKLAIKAALLNQSILHGVGNIYADESLFRAGIRPRRSAGRLTRAELDRLHAALQSVLAQAIALGGSSVSDYVDADGVRGFFQLQHKVYGRAGEVCTACATPLKKVIAGGRTTIYCPQCQH